MDYAVDITRLPAIPAEGESAARPKIARSWNNHGSSLGFLGDGHWLEVFNSDIYDSGTTAKVLSRQPEEGKTKQP
jgi:hypothetical protein